MKNRIQEREQMIIKSNALIQEARFSMTVQQQRIILYMISKIKPNAAEFEPCQFSVMDFCELCGIEGKKYASIKGEIEKLSKCKFWVETEGSARLKSWIASDPEPTIDKGSGLITLTLSNSMKDYLLELRDRFTQYELIWVLAFRRKYSIRLYEYICSKHYHDLERYEFEIDVDTLKKIMGAETYQRFADFHAKALSPAVDEINAHSDKTIEYTMKKAGKFVKSVSFTVSSVGGAERIKRENDIQHELGIDPNQLTLWEQLEQLGEN